MNTALIVSAGAMGLAAGPHCVAMCGAACGAAVRACAGGPATAPTLQWHAGRIAGYAAAGAVAASVVGAIGVASEQVAPLRPAWLLLHAFVLAWGVLLLATGRQPLWVDRAARGIGPRWGPGAVGALWVAMPCGLLYSALLLASLAGDAWQGALAMAGFAAASGLSLVAAPWLLRQAGRRLDALRQKWGTRLAGLLLAAVALQALWIDVARQVDAWCR